jgi:hypothetical protein
MILEFWSIALITCSLVTVFLGVAGAAAALQVIRRWDLGSDSERQIRLEERVWLAAALVQFGLVVQVVSALIFIYAADYFATVLKGAMCAAGSLTANIYGLPALGVKLVTIFMAGLWIVLHRLDIGHERFPLTILKSFCLLALLPFLLADALLVFLYLVNLEPEIITSCCGIIFGETSAGGYSLFDVDSPAVLFLSGGALIALVVLCSCLLLLKDFRQRPVRPYAGWILAGSWVAFYLLALALIIVWVSPYVYGLPHHRCPFDLIQYPYSLVGLPLYLFLHGAVLSGLAAAAAAIVCGRGDTALQVEPFIRRSAKLSLALLLLFLVQAAWPPLKYIFFGGQ